MIKAKITTTSFNADVINQAAQQAAKVWADKINRMLDTLATEYAGQPVDTIKPVLATRWKATAGADIDATVLTKYTEQIAAGGKVEVRTN